MKKFEIAKIFYEMADFLEMMEVEWKPRAYERAARAIEQMPTDIAKIAEEEKLEKIPGVGQNLADKIEEYLETGKIKEYEKLKKETPVKIGEMTAVEGVGPKTVKTLYKELGVKNLKDLEKAAKEGKIRDLEGFGEKTEKNILKGIEFVKDSQGRLLLGKILPIAENIKKDLRSLRQVKRVALAGSLRRMKETVGDVDLLAVSNQPKKVMDYFCSLQGVVKVWGKGKTKSSVRLQEGFDADLRLVEEKSWGAALQYFTGSKDHNILTRRLAIKKNLKLNEYGVFKKEGKKEKWIAGREEKGIYGSLGLAWMPPEIRQNEGEIEAAQKGELPNLVKQKDVKGDLQMHTTWSDGENSLEEMAKAAQDLDYNYIAITDHIGWMSRGAQNSLNRKRLLKQIKKIDELNAKLKVQNSKLRILKGGEVDITKEGRLAMKDEILAKLDWVVAAIHYNMRMSKQKMTKRLVKAIKSPHIDLIAHPTGRLINQRPGYNLDWKKVFKAARETKTILEINASMDRLDLKDEIARRAKESGVKLAINTDAHSIINLKQMHLGVAQARRAWCEKGDIYNTNGLTRIK